MEYLSKKKFFKITNKEEKHHGFQYTDGLNILQQPFTEIGSCVPGGLYVTDIDNILQFLDYGIYLREITLPLDDPDFKIVKDDNKWRANKIILGKRYNLCEKETFEYLVSLGADIRNDYNALMYASFYGYLDVIKYLVSIGADIHVNDDFPLRWVSKNGHLDAVKYLVSVGADIHADDDFALRWASINGHLDVAKYLVSAGAKLT